MADEKPQVTEISAPMASPLNLIVQRVRPPFWMIVAFLLMVVASWVPLVLIARARVTTSDKPRVHIFQDMDVQPKYGPQSTSLVFADGRAMRPEIPGTIARGELREDDHLYRGYTATLDESSGKWDVDYFDGLPEQIPATDETMKIGAERFITYCAPCHGLDGAGQGMVVKRSGWSLPSDLHKAGTNGGLEYGPENYPDGRLYHTITHGIRNMAGYERQISVEDRWAIVMYVRALQLSQHATLADVPDEQREALLR